MENVRWWKLGAIRTLALCVMAVGIHGMSYNFERHSLMDFSHFSGPTSIVSVLVGLSLFVLGFRTEREHEKVSRITNP